MSNAKPAESLACPQLDPQPSAAERTTGTPSPAGSAEHDRVERDRFSRPPAPPLDFSAARESGTRASQPDPPPSSDCPPTVRTPRLRDLALAQLAEREDELGAERSISVVEAEPDDDSDALRVAGAEADFFRFESFPPVVEDLDEPDSERTGPPPPTAEQRVRTSRLRKGVGAVVALAAVLAVVAVVIGAVSSGDDDSRALALGARRAPVAQPLPVRSAADDARRSADGVRSERNAAHRPASAAADADAPGESTAASDMAQLRSQAVAALAAQRLELAEQLSRQLIADAPDHAFGYRCLGAVLQDRGEWSRAHEIYGACVRHAERGDVGECAALGGSK